MKDLQEKLAVTAVIGIDSAGIKHYIDGATTNDPEQVQRVIQLYTNLCSGRKSAHKDLKTLRLVQFDSKKMPEAPGEFTVTDNLVNVISDIVLPARSWKANILERLESFFYGYAIIPGGVSLALILCYIFGGSEAVFGNSISEILKAGITLTDHDVGGIMHVGEAFKELLMVSLLIGAGNLIFQLEKSIPNIPRNRNNSVTTF